MDGGFTLLELMMVVSIAGILATLAEPSYQYAVTRAREATLKHNLFSLREVIDQHKADRGKYPPTLEALVALGYLRQVPFDPFTKSQRTWQVMIDEGDGGVLDVHSGSSLVATDGTPYNQW